MPLGLLRKMVRVRVERAGAVTLHHAPPTADSAARRRARHLLRAPGPTLTLALALPLTLTLALP